MWTLSHGHANKYFFLTIHTHQIKRMQCTFEFQKEKIGFIKFYIAVELRSNCVEVHMKDEPSEKSSPKLVSLCYIAVKQCTLNTLLLLRLNINLNRNLVARIGMGNGPSITVRRMKFWFRCWSCLKWCAKPKATRFQWRWSLEWNAM